jgi:hypothetical protein
MKRLFLAVGLLVLVVALVLVQGLAPHVLAAPRAQDAKPVIAQPEANATVRGVVQIVGTATHPQFQRYELYYAPWPVPGDNAWTFIGPDAKFQQQPLGLLGTWDSRAVPDGQYALRVRVVKRDANYIDSEPRQVVVANTKPVEPPTPTASPTGEASPTPVEAAATVPVPTPESVATVPPSTKPSPQPSPTKAAAAANPAAAATPILASASEDPSSLISSAGKAFNVGKLFDTAQTAAIYTIALFVAIALFFAVKALLFWLWQKMRP